MKLDRRFERGYRMKAFGYFLQWLSAAERDYSLEVHWFSWVLFWHHEATAPASELRGEEVRHHIREREEHERRHKTTDPDRPADETIG